MPIQFRCGACQQLLGIARRKAGKVVDCPTCGKRTLVPLDDPLETGVTEPIPPPLPPIQRQVPQPVSIFDRVDVDKLLEPPGAPDVLEEHRSATAVAEPPPRKRIKRLPDPSPEEPSENPQPFMKLEEPKTEPESDEPFPLAQVPTLRPVPKAKSNLHLLLGALGLVIVAIGIFFAGHWFGSHRPLF